MILKPEEYDNVQDTEYQDRPCAEREQAKSLAEYLTISLHLCDQVWGSDNQRNIPDLVFDQQDWTHPGVELDLSEYLSSADLY